MAIQPETPSASTAAATQIDPTGRFTDRVKDYAACRPSYPALAFRAVLDGLGPAPELIAADIGAGTGISSRLLAGPADRPGPRVEAIEPNGPMRAAAEPHPRIRWHDATGEATGLADRSVDAVVCAQAFHWLRAGEALAEFDRILKRRTPSGAPGRVALVWNVHDDADDLVREYRRIILAHATDPPRSPWATEEAPALRQSTRFRGYRLERFRHAQRLDMAGLIGRARSSSYVPREGECAESLRGALAVLHARFARDGLVTLPYRCEVHLAEVA